MKTIDYFTRGRRGIRTGQIPTMVSYDVPASPIKRAHHVKRRQWINPEQAIKTKAKIDWELIDRAGIKILAPDEINPDISSKVANEYFKMFYRGEKEPDFQKRLHRHMGAGKLHPVSKLHKGEKIRAYHKDELLEFSNEYYGRHEKPSWLDQYNIQIKTVPIRIGEFKTRAKQYFVPKGPSILTWEREGPLGGEISYVYSEKHFPRPIKFMGKNAGIEALNTIKRVFERELVKKAIDKMIQLESFKENIIKKADDLLNHFLREDRMIYSDFKSGEDEVNLTGVDGNYSISMNQIPMVNTSDLKEAISRYYSEISKIINAQNEDKDLALESLGERLITMNREIRPMIEKLGDNDGAIKWLKDMDFSELNFETDDNGILKFLFLPSITTAEPWKGAQVQMVPLNEELGQGADPLGKPGRKELKREDYKKVPKEEIKQKPIDESKNPVFISPASIMH